jgi:uncharacterized membrane protein HdeD (DUF308 family)
MADFFMKRSQRELGLAGIGCVLFAIFVLAWPHLSLRIFVLLFGLFTLVFGLITVSRAIRERQQNDLWWTILLLGILSLVFAGITIFYPGLTLVFLLSFIGIWALASGCVELVVGLRTRSTPEGLLLLAAAVLSFIFGFYMIFHPAQSVLVASWIIASYMFVFGLFLFSGSLFMRVNQQELAFE